MVEQRSDFCLGAALPNSLDDQGRHSRGFGSPIARRLQEMWPEITSFIRTVLKETVEAGSMGRAFVVFAIFKADLRVPTI